VASEQEHRLVEYERQVGELQGQLKGLEEEVIVLRRRLQDAPKRVRTLEEKILETKGQLAQAVSQNERLSATLREAREHIAALREEVEKLTMPPSAYGTFLSANDDGTVDIYSSGRKMRVSVHPEVDIDELQRGQEVALNESFNVVLVRDADTAGEVVVLKEVLEDGLRALIVGRADEERVCELGATLLDGEKLRAGDHLLMDGRSGLLVERIPRPEVEELVLEEVPDVTYDDVGGLDEQIDQIKDAVELPYLYADLFHEHQLQPPKGILLYGPPGCGKTLIAKAVANSLAKRVAEKTGATHRSYFLNIKGPELLNKYVGETERQIRLIFQRAREKSEEGYPVIVFFDEMDSLFRTRGTGISSDIESTIVPQLLAEIDGVESLKNVIVIGASNREDLIDPAILRPGRLDVKIKIERPDETSAKQIFHQYLTPDLPIADSETAAHGGAEHAVDAMIDEAVTRMYAVDETNRFLEVTYQNGDKEILFFKDFSSGAMIENIVRRSKKLSIKRLIEGGDKGICTQDLLDSIKQEFREHEDLPNTTNPDDWAKISGKKGERIVYVRTILSEGDEPLGGRQIERVQTGQYL